MKNTILLLFLILLSACAKQRTPTGGPKDMEAPKLIRAIPPNESTSFTTRHIILYFDEFIQIKSNGKNLFSSPPLNVEVKVRKNQLHISILDSLLPNTTYTLQFRGQLSDLNEGNPVKDLNYTFSTGKYLDSLKISGTVIDALSGEPIADAMIGVYRNLTDSFTTQSPDFLAFSDPKGLFTVPYLAPGKYRILAFEDVNKNFKYDLYREAFAYTEDVLTLRADTMLSPLKLSMEINPKPKISCSPYGPQGFLLTLSRPRLPEEAFLFDPKTFLKIERSADSVLFYQISDTLISSIYFKSFTRDTLEVLCQTQKGSGTKLEIKSVHINNKSAYIVVNALIDSVLKPMVLINKNDSLLIFPSTVHYDTIFIDDGSASLESFSRWLIPMQGLLLHNQQSNDQALVYELKERRSPAATLKIHLNDSLYSSSGKILLLKTSGKEIKRYIKANRSELTITPIAPGNYTLSVIIDKNGNKAWDAASLIRQEQPEPVFHFPEKILIKPGWVQESEISLNR